jgi:phosphatidylserine/phosphatidylglycerophosphate/cardiolipin synthase-like enzyme
MPGNLNTGLDRSGSKLKSVSNVSVLFDPVQIVGTLARLIVGSKQVVGCVAWLTHPTVIAALEKTDSSLIITRSRLNPKKRDFKARGIKVKLMGKRRLLMHQKFLVGFDDRGPAWIALGSFNITKAAVRNLENMIVVKDRKLARVFYAEYQRLA